MVVLDDCTTLPASALAEAILAPADQQARPLVRLETLYEEHHRVAIGLAYRILGNRLDAEDAVQEALLSVWRALATYDPLAGSIRSWLLGVVRNRAIDALRSRRRRPECVLEDYEFPVDAGIVDGEVMAAADRDYVLDLILALPAPQREALKLAYFAGLSHTEIAGVLHLPVGTVKGRIRMALDRLRLATLGTAELIGRVG